MTSAIDSWSAVAGQGATFVTAFLPWVALVAGLAFLGVVSPWFIRMMKGGDVGDASVNSLSTVGVGVASMRAPRSSAHRTRATAVATSRADRRPRAPRPERRYGRRSQDVGEASKRAAVLRGHLDFVGRAAPGSSSAEKLNNAWRNWHDDPYMVGAEKGRNAAATPRSDTFEGSAHGRAREDTWRRARGEA
jgi:hypothetical protein